MMMKMIIWKSNVNGSCHNIPTAIKYLFNKSGAIWVEVIAKMPQKSVVSSDISHLKTFKYKMIFCASVYYRLKPPNRWKAIFPSMFCHHWLNKALFTTPLKIVFTEFFTENMNVLKWIWGIKLLKECSKHIDRLYKMHTTQLFWGHRSHSSRLLSPTLCKRPLSFWTSTNLMLFPLNSYLREQTGEQRRISHSEKHAARLPFNHLQTRAVCVRDSGGKWPGKRGEGGRETFPKASKALEARREGRSLDGGLRWSVTGCSQRGNGCV